MILTKGILRSGTMWQKGYNISSGKGLVASITSERISITPIPLGCSESLVQKSAFDTGITVFSFLDMTVAR
jgi:hypothetical protein